MKKVHLISCFSLLVILFLSSCSEEPPADKIKGSYGCMVQLFTRYKLGDKWRDTAYVYKENNAVVIDKVDDNTISIKATSKKLGEAVVNTASIRDNNSTANFSGDGTFTVNNRNYDANISGTFGYESHNIAVDVRVTGFPNSGNKYILSFTNNR